MDKRTIFILGTGHNGSTLLDLLLGSHSKAVSLGEVYRIAHTQMPDPVCDICEGNCDFWTAELQKEVNSIFQKNSRITKYLGKLFPEKSKHFRFYQLLLNRFNAELLVDSSKKTNWIGSNLKILEKSKGIKPVLIYLSRDGRAVVNSFYRKYPEKGIENISKDWCNRIEKINMAFTEFEGEKLHVRYKDLTEKPEDVIKNVCETAGLNFEPEMLNFWKFDHHPVGGNSGTKSFLQKFKKVDQPKLDSLKETYYSGHGLGIQYDDRWRRELSSEQIKLIEEIIGSYNESIKE